MKNDPVFLDDTFEVHIDGNIYRYTNGVRVLCPRIKNGRQIFVSGVDPSGKVIMRLIHRLYARAFIHNPDPETRVKVRPVDGDYSNLSVDNLYWTRTRDFDPARTKICPRCKHRTTAIDNDQCSQCQIEEEMQRKADARKQAIIDSVKHIRINRLLPAQRKYMALRQEGMSYADIARAFGVTHQTVQNTITRTTKQYNQRYHRTNQKRE